MTTQVSLSTLSFQKLVNYLNEIEGKMVQTG